MGLSFALIALVVLGLLFVGGVAGVIAVVRNWRKR